MNSSRQIASKIPVSHLLNAVERENRPRTLAMSIRGVSTNKGNCDTDPKKAHVIFGPNTDSKHPETLSEKLQEKMKNRSECVSKPPPVPEKPKKEEIRVEPIPKPKCMEAKPAEPPKPTPHICGETARKEIFRQVVHESIFKQTPKKICVPKPIKTAPSLTAKSSTLSRIEQTLSKMLATAIFGFIATLTWLYGDLTGLVKSGTETNSHQQENPPAPAPEPTPIEAAASATQDNGDKENEATTETNETETNEA